MKILHLCLANFYIDNCGYQENILPKVHKKQGHSVYILASTENRDGQGKYFYTEPKEYTNENGIPVKRIPYVKWLPLVIAKKVRLYVGLYESIEKFAPDVIFCHCLQFLSIKELKRYMLSHPKVRLYIDNHTDNVNRNNNWFNVHLLHRTIYKHCAHLIIPYTTKFYGTLPIRCIFLNTEYGVPENKIDFLPLGLDVTDIDLPQREVIKSEIRASNGLSSSDFVIVCGGRLESRKNIVQLIKAVLSLNNDRIKLFLFGAVSDDIKSEVDTFINNNRIIFVGRVSPNDIYKYLLVGDIAVFPGTHSVIWEQTVALGIPCIFKRWDNITHVDIGGNCIFIEDGEENTIADAINIVYDNPAKLNDMRSIALEKGLQYFSYDNIAKKAIES